MDVEAWRGNECFITSLCGSELEVLRSSVSQATCLKAELLLQ